MKILKTIGLFAFFIIYQPSFGLTAGDLAAQPDRQMLPDHGDALSAAKKHYVSELWTIENGLPINHINQVYQTGDRFLWLASFNGLIRFDGVEFVEYNSGNTESLPSNRMIAILPGSGNEFWINTEQGHLILAEHGSFTTFDSLPPSRNFSVLPEDNGTWIGAEDGLYQFKDGEFRSYKPELFKGRQVKSILRVKDGSLWALLENRKILRFYDDPDIRSVIEYELAFDAEVLFEDQSQRVWFGRDQLGTIDANGSISEVTYNGDFINLWNGEQSFIFDFKESNGTIFISVDSGLLEADQDKASAIDLFDSVRFKTAPVVNGNSLTVCPDQSVWAIVDDRVYKNGNLEFRTESSGITIFCDIEHNLWVTTLRDGLHRYRASIFENFTFDHSGNNIYGIYQDSYGGLWMGDINSDLTYVQNDGDAQKIEVYDDWGFTASFAETGDGSLWIGSQRCKPENRTSTGTCRYFDSFEGLKGKNIFAIHEDREGNIWFGTEEGVYLLENTEPSRFFLKASDLTKPVRYFLESRDSVLWMATNGNGVLKSEKGKISIINTETGISSNNVRSLYEDVYGFIWIATEDRGLNRIDPATGEIVSIRKTDGLYDDGLHAILEDDYGNIWVSTNRGIFSVPFTQLHEFANGDRKGVISRAFTERDGMLNREANGGFQASALKTEDGQLLFATQNGVVVVDPVKSMSGIMLPSVIVEDVISAGKSLLDNGAEIIVKPEYRSIGIRFNCPVFMAPERLRFRYKLEGFDSDWIEAGNRREATYTNLPEGEYLFRVSAFFDQETAAVPETTLAFVISPRFYETYWFSFLVILLVSFIAGGGYRIRVNNIRSREIELENLVNERTQQLRAEKKVTEAQSEKLKLLNSEKNRFFANISHEFRTPLTLTIGPLEDLRDGLYGPLTPGGMKQVDLGIRNERRLLRLVGQLLDLARLEDSKFKLNLQTGNICEYLRSIAVPFDEVAGRSRIHFNVYIPHENILVNFDPGHFDKIIANLLSNAFKFTSPGGSVTLQLEASADRAVVSVRDTGPGIPADELLKVFDRFYQVQKSETHPGSGIGLSLAKELTEMHNGKIDVESSSGEGSLFKVYLPLIHKERSVDSNDLSASILEQSELSDYSVTETESGDADDGFKKTILIADDHPDIRDYLNRHLKIEFNIIEESSGNRAFKKIKNEIPDLIISDVMMTDGDGIELLKNIRSDPETHFLPVILLTARAEAEDKLSGLKVGADDYITKPFNIRELSARINSLFEKQQRLKNWLSEEIENERKIHPERVETESSDQIFLHNLKRVIEANLIDENFSVEMLAEKMNQSRSNLHRRMSSLTNETPSGMIRRLRLETGAQLLVQNAGTVSEIAYSSGFKSVAHFSRAFRDHFKMTPTEYAGCR